MRGLLCDWIECVSNNGMCNLAPTEQRRINYILLSQIKLTIKLVHVLELV
jgi:hypothetical protein